MSTSFFVNGKQVKLKSNDTFEDIFDGILEDEKKKTMLMRASFQIKYGKQMIQKSTKINQYLQGGEQVECLDKNQANFQPIPRTNFSGQSDVLGFTTLQPPISPFPIITANQMVMNKGAIQINQQPPIPSNQPPQIQQKPLNLQDALKDQANKMLVNKVAIKRQQIYDTTGSRESDVKTIKGYKVQIKEFGKVVTLESEDGSFKVTFLEENASETEQDNIVLSFNDIIKQPETQLKLAMGRNPSQSTKVLFLTGFKGIAIKWVTGLQTKFEFWLDE